MFERFRLIMITAVLLPAQALAQEGQSTTERLELSPQAAGRVARHDLESILQPGGQFLTGSHIIANEGYLYTHPIETGFPGLCQHDQIIISYATATNERHISREQPLEPYSLRVEVEYRAIRDRVTIPDDDHQERYRPFEGSCRGFSGKDNEGWFSATDAYTAARGYNVLQSVAERLHAGTLKFAKCDYGGGEDACREALFHAARGEYLWTMADCDPPGTRNCLNISTYGDSFIVRTKDEGTGPDAIESVEAEAQIIVT